MEALLGFEIGFRDYATFATMFVIVVAGLATAVFILGLPGGIAIARKHPEADAVDVRRETEEMLGRLTGKAIPK